MIIQERDINVKATKNLEFLQMALNRFRILQGGTRSGKTYAICQYLILKALTTENLVITVVRRHQRTTRGTVVKDFQNVFNDFELDYSTGFNRTELVFKFSSGSSISVIGCDDPARLRGRYSDILWLEEVSEISEESFVQLNMRTKDHVIMSFNPSMSASYIYDLIDTRGDDVDFIKTTYHDNPYLSPQQIKEIEDLKNSDFEMWIVFGAGERGQLQGTVYKEYNVISNEEFPIHLNVVNWGADFGFQDPTTLVRVAIVDQDLYVDELVYKTGVTSSDTVNLFKPHVMRPGKVYCDSAAASTIEDLKRAGLPAEKAIKDILAGIRCVKSYNLKVTERSVNLITELKNYRWSKDKDGNVIDTPIDKFNHLLDAMRYAVYSQMQKKSMNNAFKFLPG
jgi:phage terminase large subunit